MKKQKILIVLLIILAVAIFIFGGYLIYSAQKRANDNNVGLPEDQLAGSITPTPTPLPTFNPEADQQSQKLKEIFSGNVLAFWPSATNTIQYFADQEFGEIDFSGLAPKISKKDLGINLSNVLSIEPSKLGKVLIKYVATGGTQSAFSVLDIASKTLKSLDQNIKTAAWSPDGKNLIFYYSDSPLYYQEKEPSNQYLGQIDKDLANRKTIINFKAASDMILSWPTSTTVYISQKPSGFVNQTILSFDTKMKTFKPFVDGNGLILKWNQQGSYGLLFMTGDNGFNPELKVINKNGLILGSFPKITLPEKCVFAKTEPVVYCAIANDLESGVAWPDDYYMGAFNVREAIYRINLESLEAVPVINQEVFEIRGIDLSSDQRNLIFYDTSSQKLYAYPI